MRPHHYGSNSGAVLADLILLLQVLFIVYLVVKIIRGRSPVLIYGRWGHLIDEYTYSSTTFYDQLEAIIKSKGIKDMTITRVNLYEGALLISPTRQYLRIVWKHKSFDVCAAPFGNGFTISWWCFERARIWQIILSSIPIIGNLLVLLFRRTFTYYRADMGIAFQTYLQKSVEELVDKLTTEAALRPLTERERQPKINELLTQTL